MRSGRRRQSSGGEGIGASMEIGGKDE
jgi:hypothetical protein